MEIVFFAVFIFNLAIIYAPLGAIIISIYPPEITTSKGRLVRVGGMEITSETSQDYNPVTRSYSTSTSVSRTISLIRIGDQTYTNVPVSDGAIFDIIQPGNQTALIFNRGDLVFAADLDEKTASGRYNFDHWSFYFFAILFCSILYLIVIIGFFPNHRLSAIGVFSAPLIASSIAIAYQKRKQLEFDRSYNEIMSSLH